jgi:hypothetical protein
MGPEPFEAFLRSEMRSFEAIIKQANVKAE